MASGADDVYQPKDAVGIAIQSTLITGAAGLTVSAVQNTLTKQNVTAWGVFTRSGGVIALFGNSPHNTVIWVYKTLTWRSCDGRDLWICKSSICEPTREKRQLEPNDSRVFGGIRCGDVMSGSCLLLNHACTDKMQSELSLPSWDLVLGWRSCKASSTTLVESFLVMTRILMLMSMNGRIS